MHVVEKGLLPVVGLEVVAEWRELATEMPRAWERFRARYPEVGNRVRDVFLDVSLGTEEGRYTQLVGVEVDALEEVPEGMVGREIPAGRYIHYRHEGPLTGIAGAFGQMHAWAEENGHAIDELKLDVGYTPDGSESVHDLYLRLAS